MIFHVLTVFPDFFSGPFEYGVVARAKRRGILDMRVHDLRKWTADRHQTVDDRPFGGGEGMVMKPEPIFDAAESILPHRNARTQVLLLSAHGQLFDQVWASELAKREEILLICGRYEGVDERVAEHLADAELSIGDYVLSGGELGAAVVVDTVSRLLPGVLGNESSSVRESFRPAGGAVGSLDCPHYTRPADFRGWKVPEVLLSGHHEEIERWRRDVALQKTARLRPDLLERQIVQAAEETFK